MLEELTDTKEEENVQKTQYHMSHSMYGQGHVQQS